MSTSGECKAAVKKLRNLVFTPKSEVKEYRQKMDETQTELKFLKEVFQGFCVMYLVPKFIIQEEL